MTSAVQLPYRTGGYGYEIGDRGKHDYSENTFTCNLKLDPTDSSSLKANLLYSLYYIDSFGSSFI
jgi:hypothetical protein